MNYDGDLQQLGFFLAYILMYMPEYGQDFQMQGTWDRVVTWKALEGVADRWMMTVHNINVPELRNIDHFMMALHHLCKDPLTDQKAHDWIRTMKHGRRLVAKYTEEF